MWSPGLHRRSCPEAFCRKGVLKNFAKLTGKHLCWILFYNKVAGLRTEACNLIKKETPAKVFFFEFCEISKNIIFTEHLGWLFLSVFLAFLCSMQMRKTLAAIFFLPRNNVLTLSKILFQSFSQLHWHFSRHSYLVATHRNILNHY